MPPSPIDNRLKNRYGHWQKENIVLIETIGDPATMMHTFVDGGGRRVAYVTPPRGTAPPDWNELADWVITVTVDDTEVVCGAADIEALQGGPHGKFLLRTAGNGWGAPAAVSRPDADPQEFRFTAPDGSTARFRRTETGYYERATRD